MRVAHAPEFPVKLVGSANLMRLSLMKGAHVVLSRAAYRKFGYLALFWRDVGVDRSRTGSSQAQPALSRRRPFIPTSGQNRARYGAPSFVGRKMGLAFPPHLSKRDFFLAPHPSWAILT
jgi:hypothetical protein